MSVIPVYEEFVSAFGSRSMYFVCTECKTLDFDARFALRYTGQLCCVPDEVETEPKTLQLEFSDSGVPGKWCRLGICSIIERPCQCKPVYHWYFRSKFRKRS